MDMFLHIYEIRPTVVLLVERSHCFLIDEIRSEFSGVLMINSMSQVGQSAPWETSVMSQQRSEWVNKSGLYSVKVTPWWDLLPVPCTHQAWTGWAGDGMSRPQPFLLYWRWQMYSRGWSHLYLSQHTNQDLWNWKGVSLAWRYGYCEKVKAKSLGTVFMISRDHQHQRTSSLLPPSWIFALPVHELTAFSTQ